MAHQTQADDTTHSEQKTKELDHASDLLTVHEVAQQLRVDDTTVRRWIKSGALDAVALPHSGKRCGYRVRKHTLTALFNSELATTDS